MKPDVLAQEQMAVGVSVDCEKGGNGGWGSIWSSRHLAKRRRRYGKKYQRLFYLGGTW